MAVNCSLFYQRKEAFTHPVYAEENISMLSSIFGFSNKEYLEENSTLFVFKYDWKSSQVWCIPLNFV